MHQWAEGTREPSDGAQQRLRVALQVAAMLSEAESPRIAQAWMQASTPQLDDRSPARLLREGDFQESRPPAVQRLTRHRGLLPGVCAAEIDSRAAPRYQSGIIDPWR